MGAEATKCARHAWRLDAAVFESDYSHPGKPARYLVEYEQCFLCGAVNPKPKVRPRVKKIYHGSPGEGYSCR